MITKDFSKFSPRDYLQEYYAKVGTENQAILDFLHEIYEYIFSNDLKAAKHLELGGGPGIYQLISLAKYPVEIHFSEYGEANLIEVKAWLNNHSSQYNWHDFFEYVLKKENCEEIEQRKALVREKITQVVCGDIKKKAPLGSKIKEKYDIVSSHFVAESITDSREKWQKMLKNLLHPLKKDGYFVLGSITGATKYRVGQRYFPAVPVSEDEIYNYLELLGLKIIKTSFVPAEEVIDQGYDGIYLVLAKKGV